MNKVETFKNGVVVKVSLDARPNTFKKLLGFISMHGGRDCFSKFQGKVWMISREGCWVLVCKNVPDLTYSDYLELSKKS
jgi:hypothetical protein